jgi:hypothetical protein
MGGLPELVDTMTGCLLGGAVIGQLMAVGALALIVLAALFIGARLLRSHLTAPMLVVGLIVGTGVAVYAAGSFFAVFEKDAGDLHPGEGRRTRCEPGPDGTEARHGRGRPLLLALGVAPMAPGAPQGAK